MSLGLLHCHYYLPLGGLDLNSLRLGLYALPASLPVHVLVLLVVAVRVVAVLLWLGWSAWSVW